MIRILSSVKTAAAAAAALILAGCTAMPFGQYSDQEDKAQGPIDTICVVRNLNEQLGSDAVVHSIEAGVQRLGLKTLAVQRDALPDECRACLYYGVSMQDTKPQSFDFQMVVDGRALPSGSAPFPPDGTMQLNRVAEHAATYLQQIFRLMSQPAQNPQAENAP